MLVCVVAAVDLLVAEFLLGMRADALKFGNAVDHVDRQTEAIDLVVDRQFHRRIDVALFLVAAHVHVLVIGAPVRQPVNQPRIAVEIEDDRFVDREQRVEVPIGQSVRMLRAGLQLEQIDHVDETDLEVGEFLAQQRGRGQRFLRGDVAGRGHHYIGFAALVVARPVPDADALGAVLDGGVHVHVLQVHLLVGDDHVDVVLAPQAVIGDGQEAVHVRRKIDASDGRALVHHHVEEAGVLMREAVVILPPDRRRDQQVQRCDVSPPGQMVADRQPLRVLIEHGVDHVDERFVGREEAVSSGQQVAFEHALHGVLAEHLDDAAVGRQFAAVRVFGKVFGNPELLADLVDVLQLVGSVFVRTEDAEVRSCSAS